MTLVVLLLLLLLLLYMDIGLALRQSYITSVARGHITTAAAASEDVIDSTCVRIICYIPTYEYL